MVRIRLAKLVEPYDGEEFEPGFYLVEDDSWGLRVYDQEAPHPGFYERKPHTFGHIEGAGLSDGHWQGSIELEGGRTVCYDKCADGSVVMAEMRWDHRDNSLYIEYKPYADMQSFWESNRPV